MSIAGGTTLECLRDYGSRVNLRTGLDALAEFAGVVPTTALGWILLQPSEGVNVERGLPKGGTLLKLRCFLELCGYAVDELQVLPAPALELARRVALEVVPVQDAVSRMNYTDPGAIYRQTVQPQYNLDSKRAESLEELIKETKQAYLAKAATWRERLEKLLAPVSEVSDPSAPRETEVLSTVQPISPAALPVIIGSGFQIVAAALQQLDGADTDQRELILESVRVMVGAERLRAIGDWLNSDE